MALKIRNIGNPDLIGDIQPGWSIDESATPHAIGDGSASVGGVQFSAGRRDDSEFLLNKPVTVYYEPEGTVATGNNVTGVFDSVDASGASVGLTSTNLLSRLTANVDAAPTYTGVDMGSKVYNPAKENAGIAGSVSGVVRDSRGNYYVSNGFPVNTIVQYSSDGNYTGLVFGGNSVPNPLANILNIAYDSTREIIYAVSNSGRVHGYTVSGSIIANFSVSDRITNLAAVGVASNGDILLAGRAPNPALFRYGSQGVYITQYGTSGTGNGQFSGIRSIDTDSSGNIYVVDENQTTFASRVQRLTSAGVYSTQWAVPAAYNSPVLSVDPSGSVYVMGTGPASGSFRGTKYSSSGVALFTFSPSASLARTNALYANAAGAYVVGTGPTGAADGYALINYSSAGVEGARFTTGPISQSVFFGGRGMAIANGYIYISDRRAGRVARYTQDSDFVDSADIPGVNALDSDSLGNIYTFASVSGGYTVSKYDKNLLFISSWFAADGTAAGQLSAAQDFKIGPNGDVYVLESNNNSGSLFSRVSIFTNAGAYQRSFGSYGSGTGQFIGAYAITVDSSYNTYVRSPTIVKYNNSGSEILRFSAPNMFSTAIASFISVSENGIYVTGSGSATVDYYSPAGVLRNSYAGFGPNVFNSPSAAYVANGKITVYNSGSGDILQSMSETPYLKTAFDYYFSLVGGVPVAFSGSNPAVIFPGWSDSAWGKLNELCAATGKELVLDNDSVLVRDVRTTQLELANFVGSPQRSGNTGTGRHVEVVSQNTYNLSGSVIFDYRTDATRTVTADVNERNVTNISVNAWLVSVQSPAPGNGSTGAYPDDGGYFIMASDGQWIPGSVWLQYGGSVAAAVSENGTSIDLTVNGPVATIGGYPAPYTIGSIVGSGRATGLSLIGSGVGFSPQAVKVATGADWTITSEDISQTINQPFITDLPTAYERGEFAAAAANGAGQTLTATIPTADIGGLGLTTGAMFRYDKAWWRMRTSKIGNAAISITADLLTTTGQHDAVVPGETIGVHDARLAALTLGDSAIKPLY